MTSGVLPFFALAFLNIKIYQGLQAVQRNLGRHKRLAVAAEQRVSREVAAAEAAAAAAAAATTVAGDKKGGGGGAAAAVSNGNAKTHKEEEEEEDEDEGMEEAYEETQPGEDFVILCLQIGETPTFFYRPKYCIYSRISKCCWPC